MPLPVLAAEGVWWECPLAQESGETPGAEVALAVESSCLVGGDGGLRLGGLEIPDSPRDAILEMGASSGCMVSSPLSTSTSTLRIFGTEDAEL